MQNIRVAAAALNQLPLDWDGNLNRCRRALEMARKEQASVVVLPELCLSGYGCEDMFSSPGVCDSALRSLAALAPSTHGLIVAVGLPVFFRSAVFDAVAMLVDGAIVGVVAKQHLAGDGVHYEPRWFKPWPAGQRNTVRIGGRDIPIGDLVFDIGGIRFGLEVCEDAWVANRPGAALYRRGVDVILNPSASHFAFEKQSIRRRFVLEGSRAYGVAYVYANLLGNEAGRLIYDGGTLIASEGRLIAEGRRFSFREVEVTSATISVSTNRMLRAKLGSYAPAPSQDETAVYEPFAFAPCTSSSTPETFNVSSKNIDSMEEFTRAVSLGLFDYLRKSKSRGFVVSLSGGADSAAVAMLVRTMVDLALRELGSEELKVRLPFLPDGDDATKLTGALLTTAYQKTRNSGPVTERAAQDVAEAIGSEHHVFDIDVLVEGYQKLVEVAVNRPLEWSTDDIALQNIQARVRSPSVWMLANIRSALLLSTSNRSEAAVGYATMDGDTSGGLSPLAGIDKAFLRRWLRWLESVGLDGFAPWPALRTVNAQQPTAELRPQDSGQTDEDDLMPYEILDFIERAAIRDKKLPAETFDSLRARYGDRPTAELIDYVERFYRLWSRNQWKRERYAPSFHVDDKNLDPKTWCRFPILSAGFAAELAELRRSFEAGELR